MALCLLSICFVCSSLLAGVYAITKGPIEAAEKSTNEAAIKEVLPESAISFEKTRNVEHKGKTYEYNLGYDQVGNVVGCAIDVKAGGFGGPINIKVGFNADGTICNTKVLSHSETPGLGDKCSKPAFSEQFKGLNPDKTVLKVTKDKGDINAITASTITSRAFVDAIALAVEVRETIAGTPMLLNMAAEGAATETAAESAESVESAAEATDAALETAAPDAAEKVKTDSLSVNKEEK